jgi:hypothetical protein
MPQQVDPNQGVIPQQVDPNQSGMPGQLAPNQSWEQVDPSPGVIPQQVDPNQGVIPQHVDPNQAGTPQQFGPNQAGSVSVVGTNATLVQNLQAQIDSAQQQLNDLQQGGSAQQAQQLNEQLDSLEQQIEQLQQDPPSTTGPPDGPVPNTSASGANPGLPGVDNDGTVSPETGQAIAAKALDVAKDYSDRGVTYGYGDDASNNGATSDCNHFVHDVLQQAGIDVPPTATWQVADRPNFFDPVDASDARAGDIIVQGQHMGIYTGTADAQGHPQGIQMGDHGAQQAPWGPGGWFGAAGTIQFYRVIPGNSGTDPVNPAL